MTGSHEDVASEMDTRLASPPDLRTSSTLGSRKRAKWPQQSRDKWNESRDKWNETRDKWNETRDKWNILLSKSL